MIPGGLHALNRNPTAPDADAPDADVLDKDRAGQGRIRCPHCRYEPRRTDRWQCRCGCVWNTFDTRGTCPRCSHRWQDTQCFRCGQWSPHEDWYEPAGGTEAF
jgi:hypothetical protein